MCNLSKSIYDKAMVEVIKKLMKNTGWNIEECLNTLEVPCEKWKDYKDAIEEPMVMA